jgi:hypothetical protein
MNFDSVQSMPRYSATHYWLIEAALKHSSAAHYWLIEAALNGLHSDIQMAKHNREEM